MNSAQEVHFMGNGAISRTVGSFFSMPLGFFERVMAEGSVVVRE